MSSESDSIDAAFADVLEASAVLDDLPDVARVHAWASSVLAVWGEASDAAAIDEEFVSWLGESMDDRAPLVLLALAGVLDVDERLVAGARERVREGPEWAFQPSGSIPTRAWKIVQGADCSIGIGFELTDGSQHSLLADIAGSKLASLVVAPGPEELFDGSEDLVAPVEVGVEEAASQMVRAWTDLVGQGRDIPESVYVNGAMAQRRLGDLVGQELHGLFRPPASPETYKDELDPSERAESNRWAISVLDGARLGSGAEGDPVLVDPLDPARIRTYPRIEQEAFRSLEWADWLGVVLGLSRSSPGTLVEPTMLLDQINRCPEVTSSIPKSDRKYYEWAFSLVLPLWRQAEVLDTENRLTESGAANLIHALRIAWAPGIR